MCDTFVALPSATASGNLLFAKNSDREPNEAQGIVRLPRREPTEKRVRCTYIEVPQVRETTAVILSKPFWMWGAEMGVNEHGVAIGNEAVFTKVKFRKKNDGLTGMDLLRLALERARTAETALETITDLLADFGQDACGGYRDRNFFYHNSFLLADPTSAWVLETAGREWVAERVRGVRSISNGLTIGETYDLISPHAIEFARKKGWSKRGQPFDFAKAYSAPFMTRMSACAVRRGSTERGAKGGGLTVQGAIDILSSHHDGEGFAPHRASTKDVCMHATGLLCPNQTTGSMVAELRVGKPGTVWLTGTSLPALSVFKPVFTTGAFLSDFTEPGPSPDASFWWQAERLFRRTATQYRVIHDLVQPDRQRLQTDLLQKEAALFRHPSVGNEALDALSSHAFFEHYNELQIALEKAALLPDRADAFAPLYRLYWWGQNRRVGL
jgi:dipeptidase